MASKGGVRPAGTDGSDFQSRTVIEERYRLGARAKTRLRYLILAHYLQQVAVAATVAYQYRKAATQGRDPSLVFATMASPWLLLWMASSIASMSGYLSLARNRISYLIIYIWGTVILGVLPLFVGLAEFCFLQKEKEKDIKVFFDIPWSLVQMFICVIGSALQMAGFLTAKNLRDFWIVKSKPKSQ